MLSWVVKPTENYDISQIARVQFYAEYVKWNVTTNSYEIGHHWFNSTKCKDMYAD